MASEGTQFGYVQENANTTSSGSGLVDSINNVLKTALFMETLRNITWSRAYDWYCELDGVPSPFQRGGVLGLPVKSISFNLASGNSFDFGCGTTRLHVPQGRKDIPTMTINFFDDEQGTIRMFIERWYNQVYNPFYGVLPATEAGKMITIYYTKATRRNQKRVYYNIDENISELSKHSLLGSLSSGVSTAFNYITKGGKLPQTTEGLDFIIYPTDDLQIQFNESAGELFSYSVTFQILKFVNEDYGDPTKHDGVNFLGNTSISDMTHGDKWLDKMFDFI